MIRQVIFGMVVILIMLGSLACGSSSDNTSSTHDPSYPSTIEGVIAAYYSAYNDEDYNKCLIYITECDSSSSCKSTMKMGMDMAGKATVESIDNIVTTGATATADVKLKMVNNRDSATMILKFKKNGSWKIVWNGWEVKQE